MGRFHRLAIVLELPLDRRAIRGEWRSEDGCSHAGLHGGVSGLSYSQRTEWLFNGLLALDAKYRFGASWFVLLDAGAESMDLMDWENFRFGFSACLGKQINARNSVKLASGIDYFNLRSREEIDAYGLRFRDGTTRLAADLSHTFYPTPQHALGPELGFGFRDGNLSEGYYLTLGFHYGFRFR
jgi:hypothetical protein